VIQYEAADHVAHIRLDRPYEPNCVSFVRSPEGRQHPEDVGSRARARRVRDREMVP
jgi:hypothetical protein